jgi:hypothetical protein
MNRRQRLCFGFGAWLLLFTTLAHLAGHFSAPAPPADATEAELRRLMTSYTRELGHGPRSMQDLLEGFSLCFSILLGLAGASALFALRRHGADAAFMRGLAWVHTGALALLVSVSSVYFFPPPTVCLGLALAGFVGALLGPRHSAGRVLPSGH